jgi:hypothetical protein
MLCHKPTMHPLSAFGETGRDYCRDRKIHTFKTIYRVKINLQ